MRKTLIMSIADPIIAINGATLTPDEVNDRTQELRRAALDDSKLQKFRTDDLYLQRFLHCSDFSVPDAYKRMQDYCNLLLEHPDWFASSSPLAKKKQIEKNVKAILPERDRCGRRLFLVKLGKIDASKTTPQEQTQLDEIWFESVMDDPDTQAKGISVILDMNGYSWRLFRWLTPSNMKVSTLKADLYPCKAIVYHVVNTSFLVNASIKLAWPFLSNKIKEMLKFHFENWPSLHEHVDPAVLPEEYGGTGPPLNFSVLNKWLFDQDYEIGKKLRYQKLD